MKIIKQIDNNLEQWMLITFYLMVFVTILMEVIQRFGLGLSTSWGEEVARYSFIYLIWISAAFCVKSRIHLKIDIILTFLPNRGKSAVYLFGEIVTLIIVVLCIYYSTHPVLQSIKYESITDGLGLVKAFFLFAVPFGFSIMLIRIIQNIKKDVFNIAHNNPPYEGTSIF